MIAVIFISAVLLIAGVFLLSLNQPKQTRYGMMLLIAGDIAIFGYLIYLWIHHHRIPLKTPDELRFWLSFFTLLSGNFFFLKLKDALVLRLSTAVSFFILLINLRHPGNQEILVDSALLNFWYAVHMFFYLLSCAFLLFSGVFSLHLLFSCKIEMFGQIDKLAYTGLAFLTFGIISGIFWAKEVYGLYWMTDRLELWAYFTWFILLVYIHYRQYRPPKIKMALLFLSTEFVVLMLMIWAV